MDNFPERTERLDKLLVNTKTSTCLSLLREIKVDCDELKYHCVHYILASLKNANPAKKYKFSTDILDMYEQDIFKLPNMTPNGLVLPKKDNFLAYNELHKCVSDIFRSFNIDGYIDTAHVPINIRIITGKPIAADIRPRSSGKLHSDIWAGEFPNAIMVFLTSLGDIQNGIEFLEPPERFYPAFCRTFNDYLEGGCLEKESHRYDISLKNGHAYITDPFLLHRTIKKTSRPRLSIDFRFMTSVMCSTDDKIISERHENYIPLSEWYEIGTDSLLYSDEIIAQSGVKEFGTQNAYAAKYRRIHASKSTIR